MGGSSKLGHGDEQQADEEGASFVCRELRMRAYVRLFDMSALLKQVPELQQVPEAGLEVWVPFVLELLVVGVIVGKELCLGHDEHPELSLAADRVLSLVWLKGCMCP